MSDEPRLRDLAELEAGLDHIRASPRDAGPVELIVRRPAKGTREVLERALLEPGLGLIGDRFGAAEPIRGEQIALMSSRVIALIAQDRSLWSLAGDQLYVDLDLSGVNLPTGTRLSVGAAVIEVTPKPHLGCGKFRDRYGVDAVRFVNSPLGKELKLRGINARVVTSGEVRVGDTIRKL